ncbi:MAG: hypothetical protein F6J87_30480 [Spirulina sp. SIO3F2]|nr:hypothetical protein [Spirulina sp. SIO3F2]
MGRKRFNNLEAALKSLRNPGTGTFDPTTIPSGSVLDNYYKFKTGQTSYTVTRTPESLPGGYDIKEVLAFGDLNSADPIAVGVSSRAAAAIASLGVSALDLNLDDLATGVNLRDFIPAKAVIFKPDAQVANQETSQITGLKYDPREGASYTLPFGQKSGGSGAGDLTYRGVAAGIAAASEAAGESVSFQEEDYPV